MRNSVADAIYEYCTRDENGFLVAGDAGFGVWDSFQKDLPKQYINPGINEQASIGLASGMASSGHKVFYYNIIPFVLMRCYEQVRIDICYADLPVVLIGIGSGITYAPAGMTHYSLEDIALAKTLPNLDIFSPADPKEALAALEYAYTSCKPTYIRLARNGEAILHENSIDITRPIFLHKSDAKSILLVHGSIADEVPSILEKVDINVVTVPMLTSDIDFKEFLSPYEHIYVLEEHFEYGGLATILRDKTERKIHGFGVKNEYIHSIGDRDYLRELYHIDGASVAKAIYEIEK